MKKTILLYAFLCTCFYSFALNITIIESQSFSAGHIMDNLWQNVATGMGHTASIVPQATLDNNVFFPTTDILIVASGIGALPPNRVAIILQFIQSGKPVYIQSEYLSSFDTNIAFASLVSSLGGNFVWNSTMAGVLAPMNVLGTYATTNNAVSTLPYYWYSVSGQENGPCSRTINILEFAGEYHGFHYIPNNSSYGTIITTTDQDWVLDNSAPMTLLMANLITHLINPPSINNFGGVNLGNDTTLCTGGTFTLNAGSGAGNSYFWQDSSTNSTYTVTQPGTYWVTVSNATCTATDTIHVGIEFNIVQAMNDTFVCKNSTVILQAPLGFASYSWNNGTTNSILSTNIGGTFIVNITSNGGCSFTDTVVVQGLPYNVPIATFTWDSLSVSGNVYTVQFINAFMGGNLSYSWDFGNGTTSNQQNPIVTLDCGVLYPVSLILTNQCGIDTFTDSVQYICALGIENVDKNVLPFIAFPQPAQQHISIEYQVSTPSAANLKLYNILGENIREWNFPPNDLTNNFLLDIKDISEGLYYLILITEKGKSNLPIMIK